jgi:hypothetical protein
MKTRPQPVREEAGDLPGHPAGDCQSHIEVQGISLHRTGNAGGAVPLWAETAAAPAKNKSNARRPKCFAEDLSESSPGRRPSQIRTKETENAQRRHRAAA